MVTEVAGALTNVRGNSDPVCTINYLRVDPGVFEVKPHNNARGPIGTFLHR